MNRVIRTTAVLATVLFGLSPCLAGNPGIWLKSNAMSRWQTSALAVRNHQGKMELWSIGDQNSLQSGQQEAHGGGYLYSIQPRTGELSRPVSRIQYDRNLFFGSETFTRGEVLRETIRGSRFTSPGERRDFVSDDAVDYEGLVFDPQDSNRLFAITEGHAPWLVQIDLTSDSQPKRVSKAVRVSTEAVASGDGNYPTREMKENQRWEGLALDPSGKRFYLACERHGDDPRERIFCFDREELERPKTNGAGYPRIHPRPALSNDWVKQFKAKYGKFPCISGLTFTAGRESAEHPPYLLALERNIEKLVVIDVANRRVLRFIDLELRAPDRSGRHGLEVHWMSPEGIAADAGGNIWLINDPVLGHDKYWPTSEDHPYDAARFENRIPLIHQVSAPELAADR